MAERYDVVVVGGRCAGAPLAILLAGAGMRVCVVDRASFPSDTPSTHIIQPSGTLLLERIGVRDRVQRVAAAIDSGTILFDDGVLEMAHVSRHLGAPGLNARRVTLDAILLEAAAEAGAEVRTETAVTALVREGGRVTGVDTTAGTLRASLVVGADGARSTVARLAGAAEYHRTPPGRMFLWTYFEGAEEDGRIWFGKSGDQAYLASPTDAGQFMVAVAPSVQRREELRVARDAGFEEGLAGWPELAACVAGARRVGPMRMMSRWHGFFRESAGPGWVLVGDAGHFKDPTPGQGITDALRQVVALAPAVERALGGDEAALDDWWAWRDADAWEMYWFAHDMGASGPTPLVLREIQREAMRDPDLALSLQRVLNHDDPPSEAFSTPLAARAIARALIRAHGQRRVVVQEARRLVGNEVRRRSRAPAAVPS